MCQCSQPRFFARQKNKSPGCTPGTFVTYGSVGVRLLADDPEKILPHPLEPLGELGELSRLCRRGDSVVLLHERRNLLVRIRLHFSVRLVRYLLELDQLFGGQIFELQLDCGDAGVDLPPVLLKCGDAALELLVGHEDFRCGRIPIVRLRGRIVVLLFARRSVARVGPLRGGLLLATFFIAAEVKQLLSGRVVRVGTHRGNLFLLLRRRDNR